MVIKATSIWLLRTCSKERKISDFVKPGRFNTRQKTVLSMTIGVGWRNLSKLMWGQRILQDLDLYKRDSGCMSSRHMQSLPSFCILIMRALM